MRKNNVLTSSVSIAAMLLFCAPGSAQTLEETIATIQPSRWLEAEKDRYAGLLGELGADVVVLPFQGTGDTLDSVGRSLFARMIAARIERSADLRVPDPGLVARALGSTARNYPDDAIYSLGNRANARQIVIGHVGHDRAKRLSVSVEIVTGLPGFLSEQSETQTFEWADISFSDTELPYEVFGPIADQIVALITGTEYVVPEPIRADIGEAPVPESFEHLEELAGVSPLHEALYLQFLGELYPRAVHNRDREHLFERSLVVLESVRPESLGYRVIKARALANLHRRPAAVDALGNATSPEQNALRAYLDANLLELTSQIEQIADSPILGLIGEIELERTRLAFEMDADAERGLALAETYPAWAALLYRSHVDSNPQSRFSNALVKVALDTLVPAGGLSLEQIVRAASAADRAPGEIEFTKAALDDISALTETSQADWLLDRASSTFPYKGDLLEIARTSLVANVVQTSRIYRGIRGATSTAQATLDAYEIYFADHPQFEMERADMLVSDGYRSDAEEQARVVEEIEDTMRRAFVWAGEQTPETIAAISWGAWTDPPPRDTAVEEIERLLYLSDYPRRAHVWSVNSWFGSASMDAQACLDYAIHNFDCFREYFSMRRENDDEDSSVELLLAELEDRFVGHPDKLELIAGLGGQADETVESEHDLYSNLIASGSTNWEIYLESGIAEFRQGNYREALETFLQYPGFSRQGLADPVTLSNRAYEAGSYLYWVGAFEYAQPLYEIAADYWSGSDASLSSEIRLAILVGDLETAANVSLTRARRYSSRFAYRDYLALLHLLGDNEASWDLFDGLVAQSNAPQLWTGAFVGHRLAGASSEEIFNWLQVPYRRNAEINLTHLATRYAFLTGVIDRLPREDLPEMLTSIDPGPPVIVAYNGFTTAAHLGPLTRAGLRVLGPSPHFQDRFQNPSEHRRQRGEELEPLLSIAARALAAIYSERYQDAFALFDDASYFYDLKEFLPYYAWAAAKTGDTDRIERYLRNSALPRHELERVDAEERGGYEFDDYLALAYLAGARGAHDEALVRINEALHNRPFTVERSVFTFYQLVEALEILYSDSDHEPYRELALRLARRHQVIQPHIAWAYAVVAKLTDDQEERVSNLATVLHLDPGSWRASQLARSEHRRAQEWLRLNEPLYLNATGPNLRI